MPRVYVSIGSNTDRERNLRDAVGALRRRFGVLVLSPVYESEAVGFAGGRFYNLVAAFDTNEPIEKMRGALLEIEGAQGRRRGAARFGPRTLDLDILLYGDLVRHDGAFDIPRCDILAHAFVLRPLADLAPDLRHPEIKRSFGELWREFDAARAELAPVVLAL